jgi:hypothetical protein
VTAVDSSVLTRLPPPHRVEPGVVPGFLIQQAPEPWLGPPPGTLPRLLDAQAAAGLAGGATCGGLVAFSAEQAGEPLVTLDERAIRPYAALGVEFRLLGR